MATMEPLYHKPPEVLQLSRVRRKFSTPPLYIELVDGTMPARHAALIVVLEALGLLVVFPSFQLPDRMVMESAMSAAGQV